MSPETYNLQLATFLILLAFTPVATHADIGGVGSPVNSPSNDTTQGSQDGSVGSTSSTPTLPLQAPKVLLVLHFDQPHPFEQELKNAVETTQKVKPDAFYQVVSYIPSGTGTAQTQQQIDDAAANLALLAREMQDLGVPNNRMQIDTEYSGLVSYQEIRVFVY